MPLISVIVPCYNQAQYLDECLHSVLDQTFQDWECIIVNDGSPDNTEEVAKRWLEKDARFRYIYKENGGLSSARNAGLNEAKGKYIQLLDCDDYLIQNKFEISLEGARDFEIIISNFFGYVQKVVPPHCKLENVDFSLKSIITDWDIKFTIPIHCAVFNREIFNRVLFNESLTAKEDFLFWTEVFMTSPRVKFIDNYLNVYRIHGENMTLNHHHMIENKIAAYELIHNRLDPTSKNLFFNSRMRTIIRENKYLLEAREELLNSKRMKLFSFLDKGFEKLKWLNK